MNYTYAIISYIFSMNKYIYLLAKDNKYNKYFCI